MHSMLPGKAFVPAHHHITEVGNRPEECIDGGGIVLSTMV
jgi:hypothetical protein